jgi:hypothetical protein
MVVLYMAPMKGKKGRWGHSGLDDFIPFGCHPGLDPGSMAAMDCGSSPQ